MSEYQIQSVSSSHIELLHILTGPETIPKSLIDQVKPIEQNKYSIRYLPESPNIKPKNGKADRYLQLYEKSIVMCHTPYSLNYYNSKYCNLHSELKIGD